MSLCTSGPVPAQLLFLRCFLEVRFWLLVWAHYFTVELRLAREQTSISLSSWPSPTPITGGESEGTSARSGTRSMLVVVVFSVLRWFREKIYNKWSQLLLPETSFYSPLCNSSWESLFLHRWADPVHIMDTQVQVIWVGLAGNEK